VCSSAFIVSFACGAALRTNAIVARTTDFQSTPTFQRRPALFRLLKSPGPIAPDPRERWPYRLVATTAEDRLNRRRDNIKRTVLLSLCACDLFVCAKHAAKKHR
jgi:hypothetical protein